MRPEVVVGPEVARRGPAAAAGRAAMSCLREEDDPYVVEEPSDEERALSRCWRAPAAGGLRAA